MNERWQASWLVRVGLASWSIIGVAAVLVLSLVILAGISEIAIPVLLGAFVAVVVKPAADVAVRRGMRPSIAAGAVLAGLLIALVAVTAGVVHGLISQATEISASMDDALATASDEFGIDPSTLTRVREAVAELGPILGRGTLTRLVSGVGSLVGFVSGLILGLIVLYYLVKDGTRIRRDVVAKVDASYRSDLDDFVSESCHTLRSYAHGRTVLSAIVAVVMGVTAILLGLPLVPSIVAVTFVGGYIPYIGAFVAGAFTVLLALADGGLPPAIIVLVVSLAANLLLENFVEPEVMGKSLDIHPLAVLIITALGGLLGGIIGLIIAVPLAVITGSAIGRLRASGQLERAAARAGPAAKKLLGDAQEGSLDVDEATP